jgi:hypothetical protein
MYAICSAKQGARTPETDIHDVRAAHAVNFIFLWGFPAAARP